MIGFRPVRSIDRSLAYYAHDIERAPRRAVAQWSGGLFPPTDSYVPPGVEGTERVVLEGLAARDDWTSRLRYGDAWTSVVEHLTDRHGRSVIAAADLDLLTVVTCAETVAPYDGTRSVTLDVELGVDDPGIQPQDYDRAWMRLVHHAHETSGEEHPRWRIDTRIMRVNLEDGAFVTEWDSVSADSRRFGHFAIELAEDPRRVVRLDLHQEASYLPRPEYGHDRVELQGSGVLPFDEANSHDDATYHAFRLEGSDACAFVDRIEEVHYNWAGGNLVYELGTWECNEFSSLEVRLYDEE